MGEQLKAMTLKDESLLPAAVSHLVGLINRAEVVASGSALATSLLFLVRTTDCDRVAVYDSLGSGAVEARTLLANAL